MTVLYHFKILRVERVWSGENERLKVTLQYNRGVQGYRYLKREAADRFLSHINGALLELKDGPWMTPGEG